MTDNELHAALTLHRLVPVIALKDAGMAGRLADALVGGGLPVAEVTLRTATALDSIRAMASRGDLLVGAGTVLTADQADAAVDAGAQFVVCPGMSVAVVERCRSLGCPVLPGVATPTDLHTAVQLGLSAVKYFPAEALGGVKMLKALAAPFNTMRFMPTGGISAANLADYLAMPGVLACGGSWMVSGDLLAAGNFAAVRQCVAEAVALVNQLKESAGSAA